MSISEIRREDCKGPKNFEQRRQVRNSMIQVDWSNEEQYGGQTWLEMHALFRLHGGRVEEEGEEHGPNICDTTCTQTMQSFKAVFGGLPHTG